MRGAAFSLSIDEHGSCRAFAAEATELLRARNPGCIVEIRMPLPPGTAPADVTVTEHARTDVAGTTASAWLALDDGGSAIAYAGAESDLPDVRRAAGRYAQDTGLSIAVVRVDVPLPAGSAPARVTLT